MYYSKSMSLYLYLDYKAYLRSLFKEQGKGGRGQLQKVAQVLNVHSTFVSLVFKDKRDFSLEQAVILAQHFQLTATESDYFLNLVSYARAGTPALRAHFRDKIKAAQEEAKKLSTRFDHDRNLAPEEREVFYSSWHYSAIRVYTSTDPKGRTPEEIASHFKLNRKTVVEALEFLRRVHLVTEKSGHYFPGTQRTYLEKGHPLLKCHHGNWRQKALSQFEELTDDEMMFTSTVSLSQADFHVLREHLAQLIKKTSDVMKETTPETVACLNIDFFQVK